MGLLFEGTRLFEIVINKRGNYSKRRGGGGAYLRGSNNLKIHGIQKFVASSSPNISGLLYPKKSSLTRKPIGQLQVMTKCICCTLLAHNTYSRMLYINMFCYHTLIRSLVLIIDTGL